MPEPAFDLFQDAPDVEEIKIHEPKAIQVVKLLPGTLLLKNFLSPVAQQEIVNQCRDLGTQRGGFYRPVYASGAKCKLRMMCLGNHWNVQTEKYEQVRSNYDSAPVLPLSDDLKQYSRDAVAYGRQHDPEIVGQCSGMEPDICVVNYYAHSGRNGLHIDKDESTEAMERGSPVVSFSIGCAADFAYALKYPEKQDKTPVPVVRLESGDALIFGGPSRKLVHALTRVYPRTSPCVLRMRSGRLNLTFREYCPK